MADFKPVFGYEPNPEAAGEFVAGLESEGALGVGVADMDLGLAVPFGEGDDAEGFGSGDASGG